MRRLVLYMITTVDGFIAKPDGTFWDAFAWSDEMQAFANDLFRRMDTAVYSRLTYEAIVPWWEAVARGDVTADEPISDLDIEYAGILNGIRKVIVSSSPANGHSDAVVISDDVAGNIARMKSEAGGDILLHCGPGLLAELAEAGLIDEYMLVVCPAALGAGKPLFGGLAHELALELLETRMFNSGFTLLRYRPA